MTTVGASQPAPADAAAEPRGPSADVTPSWYRPHLDGLRTVAVYLVVLFHAGSDRFVGGFIGVDVFFVLSGYLVTQMLLRDHERDGTVRYGRFYARRIRRLLPAIAVMLLVTAIVFSAVAPPGDASAARGGFQASFLYVANWFFIRESAGYFADAVDQSPVLHVWSLAVEEQFYLVWPVLVGAAFWIARRIRPARPVVWVRAMVAVAAAASLIWALVLQGSDPDRAYYGTDARAYQLLTGALLALSPGLVVRLRRLVASHHLPGAAVLVSLLGLVVLATSTISVGPITRGVVATVLTLGVITGLEWRPGGAGGRLLSAEAMVFLGRISYGTYLWHWPVIIVAVNVADPSATSLAAISVLVATGLAALSAQLIEIPIRTSPILDRHRAVVIVTGLAVSILGALIVIPAILDEPSSSAAPPTSSAEFTPVPSGLDLVAASRARFGETVECRDDEPAACTLVEGTGPHVLLMGDSNAQMWIPGFEAMAREQGLRLSLAVTNGCPWQRGLNPLPGRSPECMPNKEDAYDRVIPALDPDVIVAVNTEWAEALIPPDTLAGSMDPSLDALRAPGRQIVLIEHLVTGPPDVQPITCLAEADYLEDCRFVADTARSTTDDIYRDAAAGRADVSVVNLDTLACPYLPICDPVIDGNVVRWDWQHLAYAFSQSLGDDLATFFEAQGVLDP